MSSPDRIAELQRAGATLYLEEPRSNHLPSTERFTVLLGLGAATMELDLCELRKVKQLLAEGERRLQLRQEAALRRRNLCLDLR